MDSKQSSRPASLLAIVMGAKRKKPMAEDEGGEGGDGEAAAAGEFFAAAGIKPKDHAAAVDALKDFVRICLAKSKAGKYGNPGMSEKKTAY